MPNIDKINERRMTLSHFSEASHEERRPELQGEQRRSRPVRSSSGIYKAREWMNTEIMRSPFEILV